MQQLQQHSIQQLQQQGGANNETQNDQQKPYHYGTFFWEVLKVVVISLAIIIPVRYYLIQPFYVKGASMEPNFHNYQYLIIDELSYRLHEPVRGDVVVLRNPLRSSQFFIKRIIGLPGETVQIKENHIYINDLALDESVYLDASVETFAPQKGKITLQADEYFVMGDNRPESADSRSFGPIKKDRLIGRAWLRAWPLSKLAHFSEINYSDSSPQE